MVLPLIPLTRAAALTLGLAAMALPAATLAQDAPAPRGDAPMAHKHGPRHAHALLTVTGEGQATATPDIAHVTVGVSVRAETAAEAMSENAARQNVVIEQLLTQGIEERDIQTSGLSLSPVQDYSRDGQPPVVTGYAAQNMVNIRIRDLEALGPVLDLLVETGANEINGISFSKEDLSEAENDARTHAITAAQTRAEVMAAAAGKRLGGLVSLSDSVQTGGPRPMLMQAMAREASSATPVQAGELSISASVTASYILLPLDDAPAEDQPAPDQAN